MIDKEKDPVGWAALMYELEDAHEHLGRLIAEMESDPDYDEVNFRIDLGHVYSHLNRAWHGRNDREGQLQPDWHAASQFPRDLEPI